MSGSARSRQPASGHASVPGMEVAAPVIIDLGPPIFLPPVPSDWPAIEAAYDLRARLEGYDSWADFLAQAMTCTRDTAPRYGRAYLRITAP